MSAPREADLREDEAEARALGGDAQVARGRDDGARADRDAVDRRDDRPAQLADALDERARHARELEQAARVPGEELADDVLDVAAGAEAAPLAGEHDGARVGRALERAERRGSSP